MNIRWPAAFGLSIAVTLIGCGAEAGYKLGPADRISVKVQEWPSLVGEYLVNPSGVISLPMIGDVQAAGREPADVAREISDRLLQRSPTAERAIAGVEIVTFRPFFILGDVERPGEYPYRPGLTVLGAIGIAGGYYRQADTGPLRLGRDVALAQGDIDSLSQKLVRQKARAARLQAALAGSADVAFPAELTKVKDNPAIAAVLAGEKASLALEREAATQEAQTVEGAKSLYQKEIEGLNGQIEALKREQDAVKQQLQDLRALSSKGLALTPTMLTLERAVAQSESEQLNIETAIVRAQENIAEAEQHARDLALARDRDNRKALEDARDQIKDIATRVETAEALLDEAQVRAPREEQMRGGPNDSRLDDAPPIALVRHNGTESREITVDESNLVEPDDVIKVPERNRRRPNPLDASLSR